MSAEFAAVEGPRHHRAAALRSAGCLGMIVGKHQRHVEAQRRLRGEEVDGFGSCAQKRIDPRRIETVARLVPQIAARLIRAFDDAPCARQRRSGNPQPSAGARRGAAETRLLLDDQDIEAAMARGDRRGHAGRTRADHERVAFVSAICIIASAVCHRRCARPRQRRAACRWPPPARRKPRHRCGRRSFRRPSRLRQDRTSQS